MQQTIVIKKDNNTTTPSEQAYSKQITPYKVSDGETAISLFATEDAAPAEKVDGFCKELIAAFPSMKPEFWESVSMNVTMKRLSYRRLLYIYFQLVKTHKYPTLTVADILGHDREVRYLTYEEHYRRYGTTEPTDGWQKEVHDGRVRYYRVIET